VSDDKGDNVIHIAFGVGGGRRLTAAVSVPTDQVKAKPPAETRERAADPTGDLYTFEETARLFGIRASRLRYWEKTGFLTRSGRVGRQRFYTFQDLIGLRAAKGLLDQGVALRSVRRSVEALCKSLPRVTRPLSTLRITARGQSLVVKTEDGGTYDPTTGQLALDFEVSALRDDVVRVLRHGDGTQHRTAAYMHYLQGCRLDENDATFDEAEREYRTAIELDPSLANAMTNLGNLLFRRGDMPAAEKLYARALQIDAEQPEAFYNLGFLQYDRGDVRGAVLNFRRALRGDPAFADAHFNLAMALEDLGENEQARSHWQTYLALDPESPWAEIARRHLQKRR